MLIEQWKAVVGYEGFYEVSDQGRVRSVDRFVKNNYGDGSQHRVKRRGIVMKVRENRYGYLYLVISKQGKPKTISVHRLVAMAFIGEITDGLEVNHIDGCKTNNRVENLEIVTHAENIHHAMRTGLRNNKGERHNRAKLTETQVLEIRAKMDGGASGTVLAEEYGVYYTAIYKIARRELWKHI